VKPTLVLDAWAILALLQREEPAATRVKTWLDAALNDQAALYLSVINLGEVFYRIGRVKGEHEAWETLQQIRSLPVTILPATETAVFAAAGLKMRHAISYADAFAAAAAQSLNAILLTGDPELVHLSPILRIEALERMETP
jgi:predicted nucleic acid-binding protein